MSHTLKKSCQFLMLWIVIFASAVHTLAQDEWELASVIGRGAIYELDLSPDDRLLAVATTVGVWVYDSQTFEVLHFFDGFIQSRDKIDWSPDSQLLAIGSDDGLDIWNLETEERIKRFADKSIISVAWSPDGTTLAFVFSEWMNGSTVRFWDMRENQLIQDLDNLGGSLTWSPDGKSIAVSNGEMIQIMDIETWEQILYFRLDTDDPGDSLYSLNWSPDSTQIAATSDDGRLQIYDVVANQYIDTIYDQFSAYSNVTWSPDGKSIAFGDGKATYIYDAESMEILITLEDNLPGTADVRWYWDAVDSAHVAWSSDSKTLYTVGWKEYIVAWNTETGELLRHTGGHFRFITTMAWSPNRNILATDSPDLSVRLWDGETGEHLAAFYGHEDNIESLAWSPDGTQLASGVLDDRLSGPSYTHSDTYGQTLRIWDTQTGESLFALEGHIGSVTNIAYSPNGNYLASASDDKTIIIWNPKTGKNIQVFELEDYPQDLIWLPDSNTIITATETAVWVLDIETNEITQQLTLDGEHFENRFWTQNGQLFVTSRERYTSNPTSKIWDVFGKELIATYDASSAVQMLGGDIMFDTIEQQWITVTPLQLSGISDDHPYQSQLSYDNSLLALEVNDTIQIWKRVNS